MGKLQQDQTGFSAVELVLVIVIIVLIGVVGFMVYKNHNKSKPTSASITTTSKQTITTPTKAVPPATSITNGPQSGWYTYTNNTLGFSIAYPGTIQADSGCATPSTVSIGAVPTALIEDAPNYYIAAKSSIRFTLTWGANQTYNTSGCTQIPTDASSIQTYNSPIKTDAQYEYSVDNLPFFVKQVSGESAVQSALQSYWNDPTITISGWQNSTSGNYEVPTAISCSPAEMGMGNDCGPLSSNHDLRYYPAQKLMFYYIQGQAAHLSLTSGSTADSQIVNSFKVLN